MRACDAYICVRTRNDVHTNNQCCAEICLCCLCTHTCTCALLESTCAAALATPRCGFGTHTSVPPDYKHHHAYTRRHLHTRVNTKQPTLHTQTDFSNEIELTKLRFLHTSFNFRSPRPRSLPTWSPELGLPTPDLVTLQLSHALQPAAQQLAFTHAPDTPDENEARPCVGRARERTELHHARPRVRQAMDDAEFEFGRGPRSDSERMISISRGSCRSSSSCRSSRSRSRSS
jgi:hypothetical protein